MWLPSTSASVMRTILWYRILSESKSSPMPAPRARMSERISAKASILSKRAFSTFRILPLSGRIACVTVRELSGKPRSVERALAPHEFARLAGGLARPSRVHDLLDDASRDLRVLLEKARELLVGDRLRPGLRFLRNELLLRLRGELRVADLQRHDGREPFAAVVARERRVF